MQGVSFMFYFFFNDTATTEIYTLSLHDALPISLDLAGQWPARLAHRARLRSGRRGHRPADHGGLPGHRARDREAQRRSEEHTSELQSRQYLVCRLLLEKKKTKTKHIFY